MKGPLDDGELVVIPSVFLAALFRTLAKHAKLLSVYLSIQVLSEENQGAYLASFYDNMLTSQSPAI